MADVEVRAAHNVLEACAQTDTIEKVVFTSSITAVIWRDDRNSTPSDLDERNWSDVNFCRKFKVFLILPSFFSSIVCVKQPLIFFQQWWNIFAAMAWGIKDTSREDSMGTSDGQGSEHGVYKWRSAHGRPSHHLQPLLERSC